MRRLIEKLETLVAELQTSTSLAPGRIVNDSIHMQRTEELRLLHTQLLEAENHLKDIHVRVYFHYQRAYCEWRRDIKALRRLKTSLPLGDTFKI